ncbi:hypothetical protein SNEBB_003686, partial [Seison nebaliae]
MASLEMNFTLDFATTISGQPIYTMTKEDLESACAHFDIEVTSGKTKKELQNILLTEIKIYDINELPEILDHPRIQTVNEIRRLYEAGTKNKTVPATNDVKPSEDINIQNSSNSAENVATTMPNFRTPDIDK